MSPRRQPSHAVLDEVRYFISKVAWAPEHYLDALTLILATTHGKAAFTSVGHCLMTGPKGTGKTTMSAALPMLLADNPWQVGKNTTEWALQTKFLNGHGQGDVPTLVCDDVSKVFGNSGLNGHTGRLYDVLVKCYTRLGVVSMSVNRVATDVPTFTVAFLNGLHTAVPEDLASRCIVMELKKKPGRIRLDNILSTAIQNEGRELREILHGWVGAQVKRMREYLRSDVQHVHEELTDRLLEIWGDCFAVADAAGGSWPQKCLDAFRLLALDADERPRAFGYQQALLDVAKLAVDHDVKDTLFLGDLIPALRDMPEGERYADADDDYMDSLLERAMGKSRMLRGRNLAGQQVRGEGWAVQAVLLAAASLREELFPPVQPSGSGRARQRMEMTVVGR